MSSTNTANVIERVLNNNTIFNYLFVTNNINVRELMCLTNALASSVTFLNATDVNNKLTVQKHGPLFQVSHLWDISQFTFSDPCIK